MTLNYKRNREVETFKMLTHKEVRDMNASWMFLGLALGTFFGGGIVYFIKIWPIFIVN